MELEYTVRVSQRARRLQIRIGPTGDVVVILPQGMNSSRVEPFIHEHREWIGKVRSRLPVSQQGLPVHKPGLPENIALNACDGLWQVSYQLGTEQRSSVRENPTMLRVNALDQRQACQTLQRWLTRKARDYLQPGLQQLSSETELSFRRLSIRSQKTRWGSCSSSGTISLNRALLFLDADMVRYLMLHELCHTRHMNHSRRYWSLVQSFEPAYKAYEKRLRLAAFEVPGWAQAGIGG